MNDNHHHLSVKRAKFFTRTFLHFLFQRGANIVFILSLIAHEIPRVCSSLPVRTAGLFHYCRLSFFEAVFFSPVDLMFFMLARCQQRRSSEKLCLFFLCNERENRIEATCDEHDWADNLFIGRCFVI